jgi:hypothetical protein
MRINPTYRSLLDKSVNSMLSAIEIYNKPNFNYREETFAILAINAWELLLKAQLLKYNKFRLRSLYILEPVITKSGHPSKRSKQPKMNRSGNPVTCGLFEVINNLSKVNLTLNANLKSSIEILVELRDNAIHFHNEQIAEKQIQELGFACIKNYINLIKAWQVEIDLSSYNFYLMPLAYVDGKVFSDGVITDEIDKYLKFAKDRIAAQDEEDDDFDIAVSIDVNFSKGNSFNAIPFRYDPNGLEVVVTEEDINKRFPLSHSQVCSKARNKYIDFKQDATFNKTVKEIKQNTKLSYERKHNPNSAKSNSTWFYSTNIWQELDKSYSKRN